MADSPDPPDLPDRPGRPGPDLNTDSEGAAPVFRAVHPVLMVRDVACSQRFYEWLGFERAFVDDPGSPRYAGMRCDRVEIHLQWHDAQRWENGADQPTYRFVVSDVDALHRCLVNRRLAPGGEVTFSGPFAEPADTPWGTREFHLFDPDRNGLQFYEDLPTART